MSIRASAVASLCLALSRHPVAAVFQEMLRNRDAKQHSRGGAGGGAGASMLSAGTAVRDNNRRYLVLTYAPLAHGLSGVCSRAVASPSCCVHSSSYVVEFDRVCFPLRLSYQDVPSAGALMRTVRRLKQERAQLVDKLADAKAHSAAEATASARRSAAEGGSSVEMMTLLQENDELRSQVARLSKAAARRELSGRGGPSKHGACQLCYCLYCCTTFVLTVPSNATHAT